MPHVRQSTSNTTLENINALTEFFSIVPASDGRLEIFSALIDFQYLNNFILIVRCKRKSRYGKLSVYTVLCSEKVPINLSGRRRSAPASVRAS